MRTPVISTMLLALLLPLSGAGQSASPGKEQQDENPTFRKNVNVVNVFFTVKDHHGALIPNLSKDAFEISENGKPQALHRSTFTPADSTSDSRPARV